MFTNIKSIGGKLCTVNKYSSRVNQRVSIKYRLKYLIYSEFSSCKVTISASKVSKILIKYVDDEKLIQVLLPSLKDWKFEKKNFTSNFEEFSRKGMDVFVFLKIFMKPFYNL